MRNTPLKYKNLLREHKLFLHIYKWIYVPGNFKVKLKFILAYYFLPLISVLFSVRVIRKRNEHVQVLFLTRNAKFSKRYLLLQNQLAARGIVSKIKVLNSWDFSKYKLFNLAGKKYSFWHHHLIINFIQTKYTKIKIFILSSNNSVLPYLLKEHVKEGQRIINIAHGVPCFGPTNALIGDDLYYVFGEGSIENIGLNNFKIGEPTFIATGSLLFKFNEELICKLFESKKIVFISQYSDYQSILNKKIRNSLSMFLDCAKRFDEYDFIYRPHPLEPKSNYSWIYQEGVTVETPNKILDNVIVDYRIIINNWSNTSIEAGAYGIPSLIVSSYQAQCKKFDEYFPICLSLMDLIRNIELLKSKENYYKASQRAREYYKFQMASGNGPKRIVEEIKSLISQ